MHTYCIIYYFVGPQILLYEVGHETCQKKRHKQNKHNIKQNRYTAVNTTYIQLSIQQIYSCQYNRHTVVNTTDIQLSIQQTYNCQYNRYTAVNTTDIRL
jgi:hypothetical protein